MDPGPKALLGFVGLLFAWVAIPLLPAWLTFLITPKQKLGLKGPFQGLTMQTGGAFTAYLIVLIITSTFVREIGRGVIGQMLEDAAWTVRGNLSTWDHDGKRDAPDLTGATVSMDPRPYNIDADRVIVALPQRNYQGTIYVNVPGLGGARIRLDDPDSYYVNPIGRELRLKDDLILRQTKPGISTIGPSLRDDGR